MLITYDIHTKVAIIQKPFKLLPFPYDSNLGALATKTLKLYQGCSFVAINEKFEQYLFI